MAVLRMQRDRPHPQNLFLWNDVPGILENNVSRQKVERLRRIRSAAAAHLAHPTLLQFEDGGFHLHCYKVTRPSHHKVITPGVSPRLAHLQTMLGGAQHENHLRPLTPKFLANNDRFPLLHRPTSERKRRHSRKIRECRLMFSFDRNKKPKARKF